MTSRAATLTVAWRLASFRSEGFPLIPMSILGGLLFVAIFANVLAPHDPEVGSLGERFRPPFWQQGGSEKFILGSDHLGRDVLSRLIFGARVSIVVGFTAVIFAGIIGTGLGILSGYLGGWVDQVIMRVTDAWLAFPGGTYMIVNGMTLSCMSATGSTITLTGTVSELMELQQVRSCPT